MHPTQKPQEADVTDMLDVAEEALRESCTRMRLDVCKRAVYVCKRALCLCQENMFYSRTQPDARARHARECV